MRPAKTTTLLSLALLGTCCAAVRTGLDRIGSCAELFHGKRIGIVTNHTARDRSGRHIVEIFQAMPGVTVAALFGPEHGINGTARAGHAIQSRTGTTGSPPVYSLYGPTRKPTPEMLGNVDILVFDIQDIGARFYTYIYTMALAAEAAAENGKLFVVLDRPNPINGLAVQGNILEPGFASFVGLYPIPVRHGMTVGELARMINAQGWLKGGIKAELVVVPMSGWRRGFWYDQTHLPFIKPSPNMTSLETAAVYPGMCLLEGTNVSEGRGTELPFLQFGAPWIDPGALAARLNDMRLPGMRFEPVAFTPGFSKYQAKKCHGARIVITERDLLDPYWSGILIVNEIRRMYPADFQWKASHFDRLCGTASVRQAITTGSDLQVLRRQWRAELKAFMEIRRKYLLYHR